MSTDFDDARLSRFVLIRDGRGYMLMWSIPTIDTRTPEPFPCKSVLHLLDWSQLNAGQQNRFVSQYFARQLAMDADPMVQVMIGAGNGPPTWVFQSRVHFVRIEPGDANRFMEQSLNLSSFNCVDIPVGLFEDFDGRWMSSGEAMARAQPGVMVLGDPAGANQFGPSPRKPNTNVTQRDSDTLANFQRVTREVEQSRWMGTPAFLRVGRPGSNSEVINEFRAPNEDLVRSVLPLFRQLIEEKRCDDLFRSTVTIYKRVAECLPKVHWLDFQLNRFDKILSSPSGYLSFPARKGEDVPKLRHLFEAYGYGARIFHSLPSGAGVDQLNTLLVKWDKKILLSAIDVGLRQIAKVVLDAADVICPDVELWCKEPDFPVARMPSLHS
ncbi:MAG: hypothetical protein WD768_21240 [Phycisphaeraceae bacterium]